MEKARYKFLIIIIIISVENRDKVYSELGSNNASGWSSPKGFKSCFRNAPINYRQSRSDDRFTLVKMNLTKVGIMITNDTSTK